MGMSEGNQSLSKYRATSFDGFTGKNEKVSSLIEQALPSGVVVLRPFTSFLRFPELNYGFSSSNDSRYRNYAFPYGTYDDVMQNRHELAEVMGVNVANGVFMRPVHGRRITYVGQMNRGAGVYEASTAVQSTDGLITQDRDVLLGLNAADCVPMMSYVPKRKIAGLTHAGREGTNLNIAAQNINAMKLLGVDPEDIFIGIGPSIEQSCYELPYFISTDPENDLKYIDPSVATGELELTKDESGKTKISPKHAPFVTIDIVAKNIDQLVSSGVPIENIENAGICTREEALAGRMPSHLVSRLDPQRYPEGRFAAWVQING